MADNCCSGISFDTVAAQLYKNSGQPEDYLDRPFMQERDVGSTFIRLRIVICCFFRLGEHTIMQVSLECME